MPASGKGPSRADQRRRRTRAALIEAAQELLADGQDKVSVLAVTERADVGLGSFYNHFTSKEELFETALAEGLDLLGGVLDRLTADLADPAEVFAQAFRLAGRLFRRAPQLSRMLLRSATELIHSDSGLAPWARRDIEAGVAVGRFVVPDVEVAVSMAAGSLIGLGALLAHDPQRDDATTADAMAVGLLQGLGLDRSDAIEVCSRPIPAVGSLPAHPRDLPGREPLRTVD